MSNPRLVLLNDTDVDGYHFGCARVMTMIRSQLALRGLTEFGAVRVSLNWQDNHTDLVNAADLVVINGEGTLHHGSRKGRWLLEAAKSVKARGGKVALINALWQDNPTDWSDLIHNADILACRDSRSAAELHNATGRMPRVMGDLSMCEPISLSNATRSGQIIGDSVHADITSKLATIAHMTSDAELVPVVQSLKFIAPSLTGIRRRARTAYARIKQNRYLAKNPMARFLADEKAYVDLLQSKSLSVTGRFHAVCLALATRTPVVAVASNSWKIEALLEDIGLSKDRLQPMSDLSGQTLDCDRWAFSKQELAQIDMRLSEWEKASVELFDDIAALVS